MEPNQVEKPLKKNRGMLHFLPRRKIQIDILTIFIFLSAISIAMVIFVMQRGNYKGIVSTANIMIKQVGTSLSDKIGSLKQETESDAELASSLIQNLADISPKNEALISYLIETMSKNSMISNAMVAGENGNMIQVINMSLLPERFFRSRPSESLPAAIKYGIRTVDRTGNAVTEKWVYKGTNLETLGEETIVGSSYDFRVESSYTKVIEWPRNYWQVLYNPLLKQKILGIATPILREKVIGIVEIDISLDKLSNYIAYHRVGKTGQAFILDDAGQIIVPVQQDIEAAAVDREALGKAFQEFQKNREKDTFIVTINETKFLTFLSDFPLDANTVWLIAAVVPYQDFFEAAERTQFQAVYISMAILIFFGFLVFLSSRHISKPITELAAQVSKLKHFRFEDQPTVESHIEEISSLSDSVASMRNAIRTFSRYVPKEIVEALIVQGKQLVLGGDRRNMTILFSDIQDFTGHSESLPIEHLNEALIDYFEALSKIIIENKGTIDKYIGDSIMAFWGAPQPLSDHAELACITALLCNKLCQKEEKRIFPWTTRFGLHTGDVFVGNIGTTERMNYTAIGNVVNTAARLQNMNKVYHTWILITETILDKVGPHFIARPMDFVAVKGRQLKLTIYELVGYLDNPEIVPSPEQIDLCKKFSRAYFDFHAGKIKEAEEQFIDLQKQFPNDYPTQLYLERIQGLKTT